MKPAQKFVFTKVNQQRISLAYNKYPPERKQSAVMELLWIAQEQNKGWLSIPAIEAVAEELDMPVIRVLELATFYSMYNTQPVGTFHIQCCRTLPCKLRGSEKILEALEHRLNVKVGETTADGQFTLSVVECLGCCANAPAMQINSENYEDLTEETALMIVENLAAGKSPPSGSQTGRQGSKPWAEQDPDTTAPQKRRPADARKRK